VLHPEPASSVAELPHVGFDGVTAIVGAVHVANDGAAGTRQRTRTAQRQIERMPIIYRGLRGAIKVSTSTNPAGGKIAVTARHT